MKKLFTLIALALFTATAAFAQENILTEETAQQEVKPYKVYCEIVSYVRGLFSNKTNVELDFGQYASWWSADRQLVDENGDAISFNSMLDAANYMGRRGWNLEECYIIQNFTKGDSGDPQYHWIMSKEITDPSQITDGLRTKGMNKQR
ncbi:MAG: hypothetical protein K5661_08565 [Bacteroidales bacterium]|nr:hypothetical protein [Bacteroidales bacterium]